MKDINGNLLQQPYYDLAVMRREQKPDNTCLYGFELGATPEKYDWWFLVFKGNRPPIPDTSLAELEAWRNEKGVNINMKSFDPRINETPYSPTAEWIDPLNVKRVSDTTDWKAKYEELLDKLEFYKKAFEGLKQTVEQNTPAVELTAEPSNFIAECAMRAMQTLAGSENPLNAADYAWDYAEAMAAEGKKRGHLSNTENENHN